MYYTSKRILKESHGVTKFSLKEWKLEKARLVRENQDLYEQYTPLRDVKLVDLSGGEMPKKHVDRRLILAYNICELSGGE